MGLRYCKVARYDAEYRELGYQKNMGGIGAHDDADYVTLKNFVDKPWLCKENFQVNCWERSFPGGRHRPPVSLVVFDFDETLTLATFMPTDPESKTIVGWSPATSTYADWTATDLIGYNFESPYVSGSRVDKLGEMLTLLQRRSDGQPRTLAVLTKNQDGAAAVLNLLLLAELADHFSAIWCMPGRKSLSTPSTGMYRQNGDWKHFRPPMERVDHKADLLQDVSVDPRMWFPQLDSDATGWREDLSELRLEGIVLVDDERGNFESDSAKLLRFVKVSRYDEIYRDVG